MAGAHHCAHKLAISVMELPDTVTKNVKKIDEEPKLEDMISGSKHNGCIKSITLKQK